MRTKLFILTAALTLLSALAFADEIADSRAFYKKAIDAYKVKDYAGFLSNAKQASDLRPQQSQLLYALACGYALNGRSDEAIATLDRVAAMGMSYDAAKDEDLASLRGNARFDAAVARLAASATPSGKIGTAFTIPTKGLIAEGMAWDPRSKRFFVSSARQRSIYSVRDGEATLFASDLPCGIFGMSVDAKRRMLWASCAGVEETEGLAPAEKDRSRVLAIDVETGELKESFVPEGEAPHLFGDLALSPDGDVYVTDSRAPNVYAVRNGRLEKVVENGPFSSLQGIAVAGRNTLLVADYARGILRVDARNGAVSPLTIPPDVTLLGIDGIYLHRRSLIAVQNGTNPRRVLKLTLSRDSQRIETVEVLASGHAAMNDPTLGVIAGFSFYFNGNSGWELFGSGTAVDPAKLEEARVVRIPLRK